MIGKLIFLATLSAVLMLQNITGLAQQYALNSPDERIRVEAGVSDITSFAVFMDDKAVIWKDGPNAHRNTSDYKKESIFFNNTGILLNL